MKVVIKDDGEFLNADLKESSNRYKADSNQESSKRHMTISEKEHHHREAEMSGLKRNSDTQLLESKDYTSTEKNSPKNFDKKKRNFKSNS